MTDGNILHTILNAAATFLGSLPSMVSAVGMYIFQCLLNLTWTFLNIGNQGNGMRKYNDLKERIDKEIEKERLALTALNDGLADHPEVYETC